MISSELQILLGAMFICIALLVAWIIQLELRIKKLTKGTDKVNLETGLHRVQAHEKDFVDFKKNTLAHLKDVERRLGMSVQNIATVRFDAFQGGSTGGGQSFATALLNPNGDGVVISTIHTRDRVGVFSKPIKNGTSKYELTPEESKAIAEAKG